jgi:hypothetical protein
MEPAGSLQFQRDVTSGPYSEPHEFSPPSYFIFLRYYNISLNLRLVFPNKTVYAFLISFIHSTCPAHALFFIWS